MVTAEHAHGLSQIFGHEKLVYQDREYHLVATLGGHIAGVITIKHFAGKAVSYPDWWIFSLAVRSWYRGLGVGEQLVQKALQKAALAGATRVNLLVFEKAVRATNLYQKMGFNRHSIPELDAQLEKEFRHAGKRRIIMSIPIGI